MNRHGGDERGGSWFGQHDRAGADDAIMLKRLLGIGAALSLAAVFFARTRPATPQAITYETTRSSGRQAEAARTGPNPDRAGV